MQTQPLIDALNPAGGLFYHYAALRFRKKLWTPFLMEIEKWLGSWQPTSEKLLLIAPSAGYVIPNPFLKRFQEVVVIEPDPLARHLLRKKHSQANIQYSTCRSISLEWSDSSPNSLPSIIDAHPGHAILFANILGQIPLLLSNKWGAEKSQAFWQEWQTKLRLKLVDRHWASFHDVFSGPARGSHTDMSLTFKSQINPERLWPYSPTPPVITDHLTANLMTPRAKRHLIKWHILPKVVHWIETIY